MTGAKFSLLFFLLFLIPFDPVSGSDHLLHRVTLDSFGSYVMSWTPYEEDIVIELEVATLGYVGIGFSPTGGMKGADIIIAWIGNDGVPYISDRYGAGDKTPVVDSVSQDAKLISGSRNSTHTKIRFRRPYVTCDKDHDYAIESDTVRVIWAYDTTIPTSVDEEPLAYHDHRGVRSLYLKEPLRDIQEDRDTQYWDIRSPGVSLPDDVDTLYWCKLYKAPKFTTKNHFIGYKPLITPGMENHVHHMILYECHADSSHSYLESWVNKLGAQCYAANMPVSWNSCNMPIAAWAVGSQGTSMPEHVGFPLGEEHGGATYFMLEIHYNNPKRLPGLTDDSGLRLFHTPQLRRYDAGVLQVGHTVEPFHVIPPNREWTSTAHCTAQCTQMSLPRDGINIFSGVLHSHLLGKSISLQHIRYGREFPTLLKDEHYDFNYQQERVLQTERTVLPGDHLIISCLYDATRKKNTTFGGFKTNNEMCLAFLSYYPRIELAECFSRPDLATMLDTLGIKNMENNDQVFKMFQMNHFDISKIDQKNEEKSLDKMNDMSKAGDDYQDIELSYILNNMNISAPEQLRGVSLYKFLNDAKTWQPETMMATLQRRIAKGQYEPYCIYKGRTMPTGMPKKDRYPPFIPYEEVETQCKSYPDVKDTFLHVEEKYSPANDEINENTLSENKKLDQNTNSYDIQQDDPNFPNDGLEEVLNDVESSNKLQGFRRAQQKLHESDRNAANFLPSILWKHLSVILFAAIVYDLNL